MRVFSLLFFLVSIFYSCRDEVDNLKPSIDSSGEVRVKIYNNKSDYTFERISISEFVDSVGFIKLETTPDCLIKSVGRVLYLNDCLLVYDNDLGRIYSFDWSGRFLREIGRLGRGPGEYLSPTTCMFNEMTDEIIIYDIGLRKLLFYSLEGRFLREISNFSESAVIRSIINLDNGHYLCYNYGFIVSDVGERYSGLWEVDSDGKFVKNYFNYIHVLRAVYDTSHSNFQMLSDGTVSLKDQVHSDIYHYVDGNLSRYITYEIEGNRLPSLVGQRLPDERNVSISNCQEKGGYIITRWLDENIKGFFSVASNGDRGDVRYTESFDIDGTDYVLGLMTDSNRSDVLTISINSYFATEYHSSVHNRGSKLSSLLDGMTSEEISEMNPIIEMLYVKR